MNPSRSAFAVAVIVLSGCGSDKGPQAGATAGGAGVGGRASSAGSSGADLGGDAGSAGEMSAAAGDTGTGGGGVTAGSGSGGTSGSVGMLLDEGVVVPPAGRIDMPKGPTADVGIPTGAWQLVPGHVSTVWAGDVTPDQPRAEYPRPLLVRTAWASLDGLWEYSLEKIDNTAVPKRGSILVPYPFESALSGVAGVLTETQRIVYHRKFTVPASWKGMNVELNFGAVDYQASVTINNHPLDVHTGGYDAFSFDITPYLTGAGEQDLVVTVLDPTDRGPNPHGKQTLAPGATTHTAASGIWQTVWIEPEPKAGRVSSLKVTPDLDNGSVSVTASLTGDTADTQVHVQVFDGSNTPVVDGTAAPGQPVVLTLPKPLKVWSPATPALYDIRVDLTRGADKALVDSVGSYFGLRKIGLAPNGDQPDFPSVFLNNQQYYLLGVLDQGYWPDGVYTPPTDEAVASDIRLAKSLNFNTMRKHVKVESDRFYYWCDKLGMLVMQDMPSSTPLPPDALADATHQAFLAGATQTISQHSNNPSIVTWVIFNQGWGEFDLENTVKALAALDPTRLTDGTSGEAGTDKIGNFVDQQTFPAPAAPSPTGVRANILGDFGSLGYYLPQQWKGVPYSHKSVPTSAELTATYVGFMQQIARQQKTLLLSGSVYAELTDVENEQDGLVSFDRKSLKVDRATIAAINSGQYIKPVAPTSEVDVQTWRYTTGPASPGAAFSDVAFDDSAWRTGPGAFGNGPYDSPVNTTWNTTDIWMRRHFKVVGTLPKSLVARFLHDEDMQVYLNGTQIFTAPSFIAFYDQAVLPPAAVAALKTGDNVLAVHCRQTMGSQFIDFGLYDGG